PPAGEVGRVDLEVLGGVHALPLRLQCACHETGLVAARVAAGDAGEPPLPAGAGDHLDHRVLDEVVAVPVAPERPALVDGGGTLRDVVEQVEHPLLELLMGHLPVVERIDECVHLVLRPEGETGGSTGCLGPPATGRTTAGLAVLVLVVRRHGRCVSGRLAATRRPPPRGARRGRLDELLLCPGAVDDRLSGTTSLTAAGGGVVPLR